MSPDVVKPSNQVGVVAPASNYGDLRVELIAEPRELSPERDDELNTIIADLAAQACGGPEAYEEPAVREGWRNYCMQPGGRTRDHDRVVLVWDGDRLVGFNGMMIERMEPDTTILWYRAAGMDPAYQSRGGFSMAFDTILEPGFATSFGPPTYWVYRTPNPVIYESCRRLFSKYPGSDRLFPKIIEDGHPEPIGPEEREIGIRIAKTLWPDCELDPETMVLKDFLGKYGQDIWRVPVATSSDPSVNRFFERYLRGDNQDALFVYYLFHE